MVHTKVMTHAGNYYPDLISVCNSNRLWQSYPPP